MPPTQRGVRVVPTITMMAWNGDYSAMSTLLNSSTYRARLVADVVKVVGDRRADGVNIDFEPVPSSLRSQFTALVRAIKAGLVNARVGSYVTVDTMAGAATWSTGYDVAGLTASGAADALMVMAYDFSYAGSARAGGVAPMDSDYIFAAADAMRDHLARVAPGKLIWGVPYYGRAWNTTERIGSTRPFDRPSRALPSATTAPTAGRHSAARCSPRAMGGGGTPWARCRGSLFRASDGGYRQGYYDDPTSLRAKYNMVLGNDVAGIGIWSLGMDTGVGDLWNVDRGPLPQAAGPAAGADRYATAASVSAAQLRPGRPGRLRRHRARHSPMRSPPARPPPSAAARSCSRCPHRCRPRPRTSSRGSGRPGSSSSAEPRSSATRSLASAARLRHQRRRHAALPAPTATRRPRASVPQRSHRAPRSPTSPPARTSPTPSPVGWPPGGRRARCCWWPAARSRRRRPPSWRG